MANGGGIRWSAEQLAAHEAKRSKVVAQQVAQVQPEARNGTATAKTGLDALYAIGRLAKGRMNKTEASYAQILEVQKHDGVILDWKFHVLRIRLADNTFYEPDFMVMSATGQIEIHETKGGFTTDKGQLKLKLCAEVLPWFRVFKCIKRKGGGFDIIEFTKQ